MAHDSFRHGGGLNKSSGELLWQLLRSPKTITQLVHDTGRCKSTIYLRLKCMKSLVDESTGEIISLVEKHEDRWEIAPNIDLDHVAFVIGTAGIGKRKRAQYRNEQRIHKEIFRSDKEGVSNDKHITQK
jgi:hypothetical protein